MSANSVAREKGKAVLIEEETASASRNASLSERIMDEDVNIPVQPFNSEKEGSSQYPNNNKRSRDEENKNDGGRDNSSIPPRKSKVFWGPELQRAFLEAISYLGPHATPKMILEFMNVKGLTRENVASHLQKFRDKERKKAVEDPMIGRSSVHNFQEIRLDTGDLFILNQPRFANSSFNNNPYANYAFNVQANTGGPRNPQIPSLGPTNVVTSFYSPQNHSSSSGTFMPSSSNIAHHLSVNSNTTNTHLWGTQMTGGAGNMLDSNKGFITPIGYDSLVTSSSNFGERSSSGPYNESSNLQQGNNENSAEELNTCIARLFADEEPNTSILEDKISKTALEFKMLIG